MILGIDKDVVVEGLDGVQYAANESVFDNGHKYKHTVSEHILTTYLRTNVCVKQGRGDRGEAGIPALWL
jgi:hypothetical protein